MFWNRPASVMVPAGTARRSAAVAWKVLELAVDLVGAGHVGVEDFEGDGDEAGVRDPGAVVAVGDLAELVGADLRDGAVVGLGIVLDGDEGAHAADGVDAAAMAGLDGELRVAAHEVGGHGDLGAVGEEDGFVAGELLDEGEDVVPAAAVEAGGVVAELPEDFVHLEGGEDGFDEDGGLDGAGFEAEMLSRRRRRCRSRGGLRGGFRAWAGRSRGRSRGGEAPARCGRRGGRSRRWHRSWVRRRRGRGLRRGASRGRGRRGRRVGR